MSEQRYQAVLAVISEGETVTDVAARWGWHARRCMPGCAGHQIDVWVTNEVLQFFDGDHLLRTERRNFERDVRAKHA